MDYAKSKGITVINTCFIIRISSRISFAHLFSGVRFLQFKQNNAFRGDSNFDGLKKHMLMESN
jgi:hypothetical protein